MKVGILGGGLTGLTIGLQLKHDFEILEKNEECGGLCRSLTEQGFTFDYGGAHIIFSRNTHPVDFMRSVLGENSLRGRRNNKIYFKGRFIHYPFENGLSDLPKEDIFECLYHYLKNDYPEPKSNFKEWIYHTFGKGIAEKYLIPYNEKIWNYRTEDMSLHWVKGRVPKPPLEDVIKSAIGIPTEGYTHQLYFFYPKHGGVQSLIRAMENRIAGNRIIRGFEVKKIERYRSGWKVYDEKLEREYDVLVSTIPIFALISALDDVPDDVLEAVNLLKFNSLVAVMIGLDTEKLKDFTAIYFPDSDIKFHRVGFPMVFSKNNVPAGKSSLVAEITANEGDETWGLNDDEIINHVIDGLDERKIIDEETICYTNIRRTMYAYVIYDLEYCENIKIIKNYISDLGVKLCGRFSEFEYLNMDACVTRGIQMAQELGCVAHEER